MSASRGQQQVFMYFPSDASFEERKVVQVGYQRYYQAPNHRNSAVWVKDKLTGTIEEYRDSSVLLGAGSYGLVREFVSKKNNALAVKLFRPFNMLPFVGEDAKTSAERISDNQIASKQELELLQTVYPDEGVYWFGDLGDDGWRVVMPKFPGEDLIDYLDNINTESELLTLLLAIMEELARIHALGVVHGDVKESNIRVCWDKQSARFVVHFIDFGRAYHIKAEVVRTNLSCPYWAPERILNYTDNPDKSPGEPLLVLSPESKAPLLGDPNQDMYSLGSMLDRAIMNVSWLYRLLSAQTRGVIHTIIDKTRVVKAEDRLALAEVVALLSARLRAINAADECKSMLASDSMSASDSANDRERLTSPVASPFYNPGLFFGKQPALGRPFAEAYMQTPPADDDTPQTKFSRLYAALTGS